MSRQPWPQVSPEQELELVNRAWAGDRAAIASLTEPGASPLFGCIYRMVVLRQDAEDLLQDVVVRVLESIREYRILKEVLGFTNRKRQEF